MKKTDIQVEQSHYLGLNYDTKERFCSYWHQIDEVLKAGPKCLYIGVGNGLVPDYLKKIAKKDISTLDFDPALNPDIVGSVLQIPVKDHSFDSVACFQVLEHLPWTDFDQAIKELKRVSKGKVIISLPNAGKTFKFFLPRLGWKFIPRPYIKKEHRFNGQHYWEINKRNYPEAKILACFTYNNLKILKHYRVFEFPYHHFFILETN